MVSCENTYNFFSRKNCTRLTKRINSKKGTNYSARWGVNRKSNSTMRARVINNNILSCNSAVPLHRAPAASIHHLSFSKAVAVSIYFMSKRVKLVFEKGFSQEISVFRDCDKILAEI